MVSKIVKSTLPPILLDWAKEITAKPLGKGTFTGPYRSWQQACQKAGGYDSHTILNKAISAQQSVSKMQYGFERDGVLITNQDYAYPLLAHLAQCAQANDNFLSVIDFGGGIASSYFQFKQFFKNSFDINWQVVEQKEFVRYGKTLENAELRFFDDLSDCDKSPGSVLLVSGVLQYVPKPQQWLDRFLKLPCQTFFFDRVPLTEQSQDSLFVQHVPKSHYRASYPAWAFSRHRWEERMSAIGVVNDEFQAIDGKVPLLKCPIDYRGFRIERPL